MRKGEEIGSSKYDSKIRRITLVKKVADILDMKDGDSIVYIKDVDTGEIIIRREARSEELIPLFENISPKVKDALMETIEKMIEKIQKKESNNTDETLQIFEKASVGFSDSEKEEFSKGLTEMKEKIEQAIKETTEIRINEKK